MNSLQDYQGIAVRQTEDVHETSDGLESLWDLGDLLNFSIDETTIVSRVSENPTPTPASSLLLAEEHSDPSSPSGRPISRVRKRDPRLTCENFLAGRIPCSCPELDEKDEEEESLDPKRVRVQHLAVNRCQVPECGADISALKGYHRRHRVCLHCAMATSVKFGGQDKRFHLLSNFDEGKRSCKRKLERHNDRRRKKQTDSCAVLEIETPENEQTGAICNSSEPCGHEQIETGASSLPPDGEGFFFSSFNCQNARSQGHNSIPPKIPMEEVKCRTRSVFSSSLCGARSAYSSTCPTGRVSFKLYDWNPAEFPRRLRHQIFQWLACMPIELEEYIRPGCTILTLFIAMPQFMWKKLSTDGASTLKDFLNLPGCLLSKRSNMLIHLNNSVFQVLNDGASTVNLQLQNRVPVLHYVQPNCFEAGKPMVFIVCGSNLIQPKFRFLVSVAGQYLTCDSCLCITDIASSCTNVSQSKAASSHEAFAICISNTSQHILGPAFVEVENESGLSNFIPVLIGNGQICSEMQRFQQSTDVSCFPSRGNLSISINMCDFLRSRQAEISQLLLDVAWMLREPHSVKEQAFSFTIQIKRLNHLLNHLLESELVSALENVVRYVEMFSFLDMSNTDSSSNADLDSFDQYMSKARVIVGCNPHHHKYLLPPAKEGKWWMLKMKSTRSSLLEAELDIHYDDVDAKKCFGPQIDLPVHQVDILCPFSNNTDASSYTNGGSKGIKWCLVWCSIFVKFLRHFSIASFAILGLLFAVCIASLHPKVGELGVSVR